MKNLLTIIALLLVMHTLGQSKLNVDFSAGSFMDFSFQQVYEYKSSFVSVNSYYPFKTGLEVQARLSPHWSVVTAYQFLYRFMEVNCYTSVIGNRFNGYKMFTHEIPLRIRYQDIFQKQNMALFAEAGGSVDFMWAQQEVFGGFRELQDYIVVARWEYYYTMKLPALAPALHMAVGLSNTLGNHDHTFAIILEYHHQLPPKISNEFYYYYCDGVGNITNETYQFYTRSAYLGVKIQYALPLTTFRQK